MTKSDSGSVEWNPEVARVAQDMAARLRARGVETRDTDSPTQIVAMLDAVEAFESAVMARGGDLMMDEPPLGGFAQPDDHHFLLPRRADDETVANYLTRLAAATAAIRSHTPHSEQE